MSGSRGWWCGGGGGGRGSGHSLKKHKNIGFLSNTGPDPINTAIKPAFNVGQSSARQRNAISMVGRWWPVVVVF